MANTNGAAPGARPLGVGTLMAYGQLALPLVIADLPVVLFVYPFYTGDLKIDVAVAGYVLLLSRLSDAIIDPLIGRLSDRVSLFWGRRKSWVVLGMPVLMLGTWMTFVPPPDATALYLLVWITVFYIGWTLVTIPYGAWGAELSDNYHERNRVTGVRMLFTFVGVLFVSIAPLTVDAGVGRPNGIGPVMPVLAMVAVFLLPLAVGLIALVVPEPPERPGSKLTWFDGLKVVARNTPFLRLLGATIIGRIGAAVNSAVVLWFFVYGIGLGGEVGGLPLLVYLITAVLGAPVWIWAGTRWSKHNVLIFASLSSIVGFMALFLVPHGALLPAVIIMAFVGIAGSAAGTLGLSMSADVIDLDRLKGGESRAGLLLSFWGFGQKFSDAIGAGIAGALLGAYAFNPSTATHSDDALMGLRIVYVVVPSIFFFASVAFLWRFPITPERQKRIRALLDRREARAAARSSAG